jgi:hypothetical protein
MRKLSLPRLAHASRRCLLHHITTYGVTPHVPDIVKRSVECDFLLLAVGPPAFRAVIE